MPHKKKRRKRGFIQKALSPAERNKFIKHRVKQGNKSKKRRTAANNVAASKATKAIAAAVLKRKQVAKKITPKKKRTGVAKKTIKRAFTQKALSPAEKNRFIKHRVKQGNLLKKKRKRKFQ